MIAKATSAKYITHIFILLKNCNEKKSFKCNMNHINYYWLMFTFETDAASFHVWRGNLLARLIKYKIDILCLIHVSLCLSNSKISKI